MANKTWLKYEHNNQSISNGRQYTKGMIHLMQDSTPIKLLAAFSYDEKHKPTERNLYQNLKMAMGDENIILVETESVNINLQEITKTYQDKSFKDLEYMGFLHDNGSLSRAVDAVEEYGKEYDVNNNFFIADTDFLPYVFAVRTIEETYCNNIFEKTFTADQAEMAQKSLERYISEFNIITSNVDLSCSEKCDQISNLAHKELEAFEKNATNTNNISNMNYQKELTDFYMRGLEDNKFSLDFDSNTIQITSNCQGQYHSIEDVLKAYQRNNIFQDCHFEGVNFSNTDLSEAQFSTRLYGCVFRDCNFRNTNLKNAKFSGLIVDCDFTNAKVENCTFEKVKLTNVLGLIKNNMNGEINMANEVNKTNEVKLATEQQMVFMSNLGLKFDMDITAEAASGMISEKLKKMEERAERLASPASEDQKKFMDKHGYEYSPEISNGEAIKAIRGIVADKKIEARKPATEKQVKFLVDRGIEFNEDIRKGEASYLIYKYEKEIEANRNLPATENQKQKLSKHQIEFDENITKGQAYDLIKDLKKHIEAQRALPATEKQLELMEKRHLPVTENITRGEASDAIRQDNYKKFVITENQKKALEKYEIEIPENATKRDVSKLIGEAKKFEAITKYKDDPKRKLTANDFYKKEAQKQLNTGCVLDDKKICKKMLMAGLSSNEVMTAIANNSPVNTFTRARDIVAQTAALPAVKKVVAQLDNARGR